MLTWRRRWRVVRVRSAYVRAVAGRAGGAGGATGSTPTAAASQPPAGSPSWSGGPAAAQRHSAVTQPAPQRDTGQSHSLPRPLQPADQPARHWLTPNQPQCDIIQRSLCGLEFLEQVESWEVSLASFYVSSSDSHPLLFNKKNRQNACCSEVNNPFNYYRDSSVQL